ncbi:hypothetical protein AB0M20_18605 [Actinoplanes sp. NPDC051633]|uniref:hypothetical protein n=1 Tax=Actinoplanes sp. NPDC051633 TaxID=3155670 RepID=UPI003423D774
MSIDAAGAYEVRQGRVRTGAVLLLSSVVPAGLMTLGLWHWPDNRQLFVVGLVLALVVGVVVAGRVRRAARREVLFAIDADGVVLGPDDWNGRRQREPWAAIDAVVHFRARIDTSDDFEYVRHVGVVRHGEIVGYRRVEGWTFDGRRAAAAVTGFGRGIRLVEAPAQDDLPGKRGTPIPLPHAWVTANIGR